MFIDSHCHLTHARLRGRLAEVLSRAAEAGVDRMICPGSDVADSAAAAEIAQQCGNVFFAAGIQPGGAGSVGADYLTRLEELAGREKNVALGEIGLDYHYDFSPRDAQRRVFAEQLALAKRLGKPVIVHTREALEDTLAVLKASLFDAALAVFHSFTGDAAQVRRVLETGACVSYSGIATFRHAEGIRAGVRLVPEDRLMLETDAPYLSPEPVRGMKTNEPANVVHVAACLAAVRGLSPERLGELTRANAARFFRLDRAT